jgi:hypothetical protein
MALERWGFCGDTALRRNSSPLAQTVFSRVLRSWWASKALGRELNRILVAVDLQCVTYRGLSRVPLPYRDMTAADFRRIALIFDGAEEGSHMGAVDFRVGGRIFATLACVQRRFRKPDAHTGDAGGVRG